MSDEIVDYLETVCTQYQVGFKVRADQNGGKAITYTLTNGKRQPNMLHEQLKKYKLLKDKHIPTDFLLNSKKVRSEVLAGLLDTDGSFNNSYYEITQKRKDLALQIVRLGRSLGFRVSYNKKLIGGRVYYRIHLNGDSTFLPLKRLPAYQVPESSKRSGLHYSIGIEELPEDDYYGFVIDGNHRFLLGDFTVTHNTNLCISEAVYMANQMKKGKILWFNNEEDDKKVLKKVWRSALNRTDEEIANMPNAEKQFLHVMNGDLNRIQLIDVRNMKFEEMVNIINDQKPSLESDTEEKNNANELFDFQWTL
jgi:hypothetical protein